MTERFTVPCNGCAACCRRERIILRAEDDKELYVVIPTRKGNDGPIEFVIAAMARSGVPRNIIDQP